MNESLPHVCVLRSVLPEPGVCTSSLDACRALVLALGVFCDLSEAKISLITDLWRRGPALIASCGA